MVEDTASIERVYISGEFINVFVKHKDKKTTKSRLIDDWYRKQAKIEFEASLQRMLLLTKAPICCIDYVVLHELIHFVRPNHDAEFYELLSVLMSEWKNRKEILNQEIVLFV